MSESCGLARPLTVLASPESCGQASCVPRAGLTLVVLAIAVCATACGAVKGAARTTPTAVAGTLSPPPTIGRFASLRAAAASISHDCAATVSASDSALGPSIGGAAAATGLGLWSEDAGVPVVYVAASYDTNNRGTTRNGGAFSTHGLSVVLGSKMGPFPLALWPCRPPVLFYDLGRWELMTVLTPEPSERRTVTLRGDIVSSFDAQGRMVVTDGTIVHDGNVPAFVPHGLPPGWRISQAWPSPRNSQLLAVEVEHGAACPALRLYLANPDTDSKLLMRSSCGGDGPSLVKWSPDGSTILLATSGLAGGAYLVDARTGRRQRLLNGHPDLRNALWSPDGRQIAYTYGVKYGTRVAVVDLRSGAVRSLTPIRWTPPRPPYQPPTAQALAWSPDGKDVAVLYREGNGVGTFLESVSASGGPAHVLLHLPQ